MRKPLKPCSYPNCPKLTENRYCAEHKKLTDSQYNIYERNKVAQKFYQSNEWKALRCQKLKLNPLCEECLRGGRITKASICDHIKPVQQGGMPLDISNLQSLCYHCHSKKSAVEGSRWGKRER